MFISQEIAKLVETDPGQTITIKLATPFGLLHLPVTAIRRSQLDFDRQNISVEEPVGAIIMKSVSRSLAISNIASGEKHGDDALKSLIVSEVDRLDKRYQDKYGVLVRSRNPLSKLNDIDEITKKIIEAMTEKNENLPKNRIFNVQEELCSKV